MIKLFKIVAYKYLKPLLRNTLLFDGIWYIRKHYHLFVMDKMGKGLTYDKITLKIVQSLQPDTNCIDVGCNKGEILSWIINSCPQGTHFAFEPFTELHTKLKTKYPHVNIFNIAVSNETNIATFYEVSSQSGYSGLHNRVGIESGHEVISKTVQKDMLDNIIPTNINIGFIKIDVEGGEYDVILGARNLIDRCKPIVIFEFEKSAGDFYNVNPFNTYNFICNDLNYKLSTLSCWISDRKENLSVENFVDLYNTEKEFYFIAFPK
jgi:FkbM family methyltransferase